MFSSAARYRAHGDPKGVGKIGMGSRLWIGFTHSLILDSSLHDQIVIRATYTS